MLFERKWQINSDDFDFLGSSYDSEEHNNRSRGGAKVGARPQRKAQP